MQAGRCSEKSRGIRYKGKGKNKDGMGPFLQNAKVHSRGPDLSS